jgi:hypothetical protein
MPDVSPDTRKRILNELDGMRLDVVALRDATKIKTGYLGFQLAETTLVNCRVAVEALNDRDQIVTMLKRCAAALRLTGGGDVWPAVERARETLQKLWEGMEPKELT